MKKLEERVHLQDNPATTNEDGKERLNTQLKERGDFIIELEKEYQALKKENLSLKVQLQAQQGDIKNQEQQIEQFINLKLSFEEQIEQLSKSQKKYELERERNDQLMAKIDLLQKENIYYKDIAAQNEGKNYQRDNRQQYMGNEIPNIGQGQYE